MKDALYSLSCRLGELLLAGGNTLCVAESCTGGWLAKAVTDIPGSSAWFECGVVTYSNEAKTRILGVSDRTLLRHGAVSEAVALEMIEGLGQHFSADAMVAITGIAGPGGGSSDKPVGTVWLGLQFPGTRAVSQLLQLHGNRDRIRQQAVEHALRELVQGCGGDG